MTRASQAAARLPRVKQLAEEHGPALKQAFALLQHGALVGPAGTRLQQTLARAHDDARSGFYGAFDAVHRLAAEDGSPPRVGEPYIAGAPRGGPPGEAGERSGSPAGLDQLAKEVSRAARSWEDAGAALSRTLADLGLSTAPARSVSRAADRVRAQKADIDRRRAELLKADQQQAVQAAVTTIQGILPKSKGVKGAFGDLWNTYTKRYLPGVWEGTKDIGLSALAMTPFTAPLYFGINRKSWLERGPVGQAQGIYQGLQHPGQFAKAIVNWDEWKRDPVHALGQTVPGIVLAAATMGTGSASGASTRLSSALQKGSRGKPASSGTDGAKNPFNEAGKAPKVDGLGRQTRPTEPPATPPARQQPSPPPDLKVAGPGRGTDAGEQRDRPTGRGDESSDEGRAPFGTVEERAAAIGQEIKKLPRGSGKPDRLAEALTDLRLSHADSVQAAIKASEEAFGEVGGTAAAVGGGTVILPKILSQKIVLIVRPDGSVHAARGDIMDFIQR